jgi:hypothetical protein
MMQEQMAAEQMGMAPPQQPMGLPPEGMQQWLHKKWYYIENW